MLKGYVKQYTMQKTNEVPSVNSTRSDGNDHAMVTK